MKQPQKLHAYTQTITHNGNYNTIVKNIQQSEQLQHIIIYDALFICFIDFLEQTPL